jgi:phage terminase large subunit
MWVHTYLGVRRYSHSTMRWWGSRRYKKSGEIMAKVQNINMQAIVRQTMGDPERNPRQLEFMEADGKYIAYGGSKGGGKSHGLRYKFTLLALAFPGIKLLLLRRTLPELRENHTIKLLTTFAKWPKQVRPVYNNDEKAFLFPNGSRWKLGYCDNENDVLQYQGQEYDIIGIDEATQFTEIMFAWLDSCLRGVNDFPKRMYLTCNPGGVGHAWVQRLFINREYRAEESPEDYIFIPAKVWDNQPLFDSDRGYQKALKQYMTENNLAEPTEEAIWYAKNESDYVKKLKNLPYHLREAWLNGRWDIFAGQFFGEFDRETHTIEPFPIPRHWKRDRTIDYGLDMLAVLWIATDEHGNSYVYRELNKKDLVISLAAEAILHETPPDERIAINYAPADLWNRRQDTGKSAAQVFAENGVPLTRSKNDRIPGWLSVKEYFRPIGPAKQPRLKIFRTCTGLIKDIPILQHDENKTNDVSTEPHEHTHAPDALRYWCVQRHLNTEIEETPFEIQWSHERPADDFYESGEVSEDYLYGGY